MSSCKLVILASVALAATVSGVPLSQTSLRTDVNTSQKVPFKLSYPPPPAAKKAAGLGVPLPTDVNLSQKAQKGKAPVCLSYPPVEKKEVFTIYDPKNYAVNNLASCNLMGVAPPADETAKGWFKGDDESEPEDSEEGAWTRDMVISKCVAWCGTSASAAAPGNWNPATDVGDIFTEIFNVEVKTRHDQHDACARVCDGTFEYRHGHKEFRGKKASCHDISGRMAGNQCLGFMMMTAKLDPQAIPYQGTWKVNKDEIVAWMSVDEAKPHLAAMAKAEIENNIKLADKAEKFKERMAAFVLTQPSLDPAIAEVYQRGADLL